MTRFGESKGGPRDMGWLRRRKSDAAPAAAEWPAPLEAPPPRPSAAASEDGSSSDDDEIRATAVEHGDIVERIRERRASMEQDQRGSESSVSEGEADDDDDDDDLAEAIAEARLAARRAEFETSPPPPPPPPPSRATSASPPLPGPGAHLSPLARLRNGLTGGARRSSGSLPASPDAAAPSRGAAAIGAEAGEALAKRGELLEATNTKAERLADACHEYRERARAERRKAERRRRSSWF